MLGLHRIEFFFACEFTVALHLYPCFRTECLYYLMQISDLRGNLLVVNNASRQVSAIIFLMHSKLFLVFITCQAEVEVGLNRKIIMLWL
jgi:hypothetical protein